MEQNFLKITYHTGLKKLNVYLKMPSPTYFVLKREIEMCLFEKGNQPRCEIRTFWIDDDEDEIEIINQCDYDIFLTKRSKHQHLQVAPINEVNGEKPANDKKSNAATDSVSSGAKIPTLIIDDNGTKTGPHKTTTSFTSDRNATTTAGSNTTTTFTSASGFEIAKHQHLQVAPINEVNGEKPANDKKSNAATDSDTGMRAAEIATAQADKKISKNLGAFSFATSSGPHTDTGFKNASGLGNVEKIALTAAAAAASFMLYRMFKKQ